MNVELHYKDINLSNLGLYTLYMDKHIAEPKPSNPKQPELYQAKWNNNL